MKVGIFMQYCPLGTFSYTIQYGDTLWILAKRFNTTIDAIIMANPGISPDGLFVGQRICIPIGSGFYNPGINRINNDVFNLSNHIRLLWEQQVMWSRALMIGCLYELPDLEFVTKRLFDNPNHFAQIFLRFYHNDKAIELQKLLTEHLELNYELIKLFKNKANTSDIEKNWELNADEIAQFLSSLNPHWIEIDWQRMLHKYLQLIKDELIFYVNKHYQNGVAMFDEMQRHALDIADMMTNGIIKQFPKQFYHLRNKKS